MVRKRTDTNSTENRRRGRFLVAATVASMATMCLLKPALATTYTWDPLGTKTGSDGTGAWDTTSPIWANAGADTAYVSSTTNAAVFGDNGTPGTITASSSVVVSTITFNPVASGSYTLTGTFDSAATIQLNLAGAASATFSNITTDVSNFSDSNTGVISLTGNNTFASGAIFNSNAGATLSLSSFRAAYISS